MTRECTGLGQPWTLKIRLASEGVVISTFAWIAIGVAAWLVVAVLVGLLIGRMIRGRDRQVPGDAAARRQRAAHTGAGHRRTPGRAAAHPGRRSARRPPESTIPPTARTSSDGMSSADHVCHGPGMRQRPAGRRPSTAQRKRAAAERAAEQDHLLSTLLAERDGLLAVLDRVLALQGTARLIRDAAGADAGFVADVDDRSQAVIRWLAGNRTDSLQDLAVPIGQGIGGRVMALGQPVRVSDYVTARSITHQFDGVVSREAMSAMLAVPILRPDVERRDRAAGPAVVAVAYAALRGPGEFGDDAVRAVQGVAANASRALRLAEVAAAGRDTAVAAERQRMQASLHDSVGAMLFSIGAQVRDLRSTLPDNPLLRSRLGPAGVGRVGGLVGPARGAAGAVRVQPRAGAADRARRALPQLLRAHRRPGPAGAAGRGSSAGRRAHHAADRRGPGGPAQRGEARRREHGGGQPRRGGRRGAGRGGRRRGARRAPAGRRQPGWACGCSRTGPPGSAAGSAWCTTRTAAALCAMLLPAPRCRTDDAGPGAGGRRPPRGPGRGGPAAARGAGAGRGGGGGERADRAGTGSRPAPRPGAAGPAAARHAGARGGGRAARAGAGRPGGGLHRARRPPRCAGRAGRRRARRAAQGRRGDRPGRRAAPGAARRAGDRPALLPGAAGARARRPAAA